MSSAMGDGLNAGAATFTPGGPPPVMTGDDGAPVVAGKRTSMSDESMMDEIEAEITANHQLDRLQGSSSNFLSAYTDLPPHADEFWFPECRNCTCCNGYKHGCQCCAKEGLRSCKCAGDSGGAGPPPPPQQQQPPAAGGWMPAQPGPVTTQQQPPYGGGGDGGHYNGGGGGGGGHYGGGGGQYGGAGGGRHYNNNYGGGRGGRGGGRGPPPPCRFFASPGGCRFGDSCRFSHG